MKKDFHQFYTDLLPIVGLLILKGHQYFWVYLPFYSTKHSDVRDSELQCLHLKAAGSRELNLASYFHFEVYSRKSQVQILS